MNPAAIGGVNFDHVVIIAMENQNYADVMGTGLGSASAPFIASLLPSSSTVPLYHGYGADGRTINGCSAACYIALISGSDQGVSDGYSCCLTAKTVIDEMQTAGLSWSAYCEAGCPRGNDHFPFTGFQSLSNSPNIYDGSSVSTSGFIAAANSASPPSLLWYTPTDNHNMHDNSISTGDTYLKNFLIGSGSTTSPASGSLLASKLFQAGQRTLLVLWWDEYDPAPILLYGPMIKHPLISISNSFDHYSTLRMLEDNWGLSALTPNDAAATGLTTEIMGTNIQPPLTTSFSYLPQTPIVNTTVNFTGNASGGTAPYTYAWSFGDGASSNGQMPRHVYAASGTYTVSLSVTDSVKISARSSQSISVSPVKALAASFSHNPSPPVSGQTVTFTDTASGGTSPYTDSWNLAGTIKTGDPVSQSFTSGTYNISLTVSDSTGKTFTTSQLLTVRANSTGTSSIPVLIGWGGIRLDEASVNGVNQPVTTISSGVFLGEPATSMELLLVELKSLGYNTVRVDFDPYCTDQTDQNYMSSYNATNLQRAIQIAQFYGFWIIVDYHGYTDLSGGPSCWLNFWAPVTQQFKNSYSQIIWEPLNEPNGTSVSTLSSDYQMWINQDRNQGDTHWVVIQNICSYACSLCPAGDGACLSAVNGYPPVTDPLGTLAQGGRIFISLHSYMDYSGYSNSWNNATAEIVANAYYQTVLAGVAQTGWPALNTEGGTDPLCSGICAPDTILTGSAAYTTTTLHFIQTLTSLYDNAPQRVNWVWWPAGSWTDTMNAGIYGAMQCASQPVGWGCLLTIKPVSDAQPLTANFSFTPLNPVVGTTITFYATASTGASPYIFTWAFGDGATGVGSTATHTYSSAGRFNVTLTASDSGTPQQTANLRQSVNVINAPPPPLTGSFTYSPTLPQVGQEVTFTGSASGGHTPYSFAWSFGDGSTGTGSSTAHSYSSAGTFTTILTVKDSSSPQQTTTAQQSISFANPPATLTSSFSYSPSSPEEGQNVAFASSASGGAAPYTFSWSFGDGSAAAGNPSVHQYTSLGSYSVMVTVTDANGSLTYSSQDISVAAAPTVGFKYNPVSPKSSSPVTFNASTTAGVGPFTFSWSFGDGGSSMINPASHTYFTPGSFNVTLIATDSDGVNASLSQVIIVASGFTVGFTNIPAIPEQDQPVTFTAKESGGIGNVSLSWDFGDNRSATENPTTHIYATAGFFMVSVTATDADGASATSTQTVDVVANLSASLIFSPSSPHAGDNMRFVASARGGMQPYNYSWSFGDSTLGSGSHVSHVYQSDGSYIVVLTITDGYNQTASVTVTLRVKHQAATCHPVSDCAWNAHQTVSLNTVGLGGIALYTFASTLAFFYNPMGLRREIGLYLAGSFGNYFRH